MSKENDITVEVYKKKANIYLQTSIKHNNIDLNSNVALYTNNYVLVIVQASNILLLCWFIFTLLYRLNIFLKKKFD